MNKKELYEQIMLQVSKNVKQALNESNFDDIKAYREKVLTALCDKKDALHFDTDNTDLSMIYFLDNVLYYLIQNWDNDIESMLNNFEESHNQHFSLETLKNTYNICEYILGHENFNLEDIE